MSYHFRKAASTVAKNYEYLLKFNFRPSFQNAKLSGRNKVECAICVADKLLATCSGESVVRFWDFEGNDNFVLDVQNFCRSQGQGQGEEVVTCIAYNPNNSEWGGDRFALFLFLHSVSC